MGRKNHQPLDKSRRWNVPQFKGLAGVTVNKMELARQGFLPSLSTALAGAMTLNQSIGRTGFASFVNCCGQRCHL
jgi:hypothetical protein